MVIPIDIDKLTKEQVVKLFSNPVSGIACEIIGTKKNIDYNNNNNIINHIQNIRYSKSMIMKALGFWHDQLWKYYNKIRIIYNPLDPNVSEYNDEHSPNLTRVIFKQCNDITQAARLVSKCPDSFLFSHRYVEGEWGTKDSQGMITQHQLLANKYPMLFKSSSFTGWTNGKKELYCSIKTEVGIEFTIFPCEHPYIEKQKITKVGITDRGNVYILHGGQRKK